MTSRTASVSTLRPARRRDSRRRVEAGRGADCLASMIQSHIEDVEIAEATVRGQIAPAVEKERDALLGKAAMRAQRLGEAGEVVPGAAGAEHLVPGRDDDDVAHA